MYKKALKLVQEALHVYKKALKSVQGILRRVQKGFEQCKNGLVHATKGYWSCFKAFLRSVQFEHEVASRQFVWQSPKYSTRKIRDVPVITEYLTGSFVKPLALAHMQVCGSSTYRIILYGAVIAKSVWDYIFIVLVFTKLLFLLIKPYVEAGIAFFKSFNVEVVYQNFG